jgi:hypothetical protein
MYFVCLDWLNMLKQLNSGVSWTAVTIFFSSQSTISNFLQFVEEALFKTAD